jgi:hypothetical protein
MRKIILLLAVSLSTVSTPVLAQSAGMPKAGTLLVTADGKRVGRIDRIVVDRAGQPVSAAVIVDTRFVYVPVTTLNAGEEGRAVTSLTRKQVSALR